MCKKGAVTPPRRPYTMSILQKFTLCWEVHAQQWLIELTSKPSREVHVQQRLTEAPEAHALQRLIEPARSFNVCRDARKFTLSSG